MNRVRLLVPALMALAAACAEPQPQTPLIAIGDFFDNPEIAGGQISPDGDWLSYLKPYEGKLNIYVKRFGADEERLMTTDTVRPVTGYFWAVDSEKLLYVQDKGGNENYHAYAVNPYAKPAPGQAVPEARDLTPIDGIRAMFYAGSKKEPDIIYIGLNDRDERYHDLYRLEVSTGKRTLMRENNDNIARWIFDLGGKLQHRQGAGDTIG